MPSGNSESDTKISAPAAFRPPRTFWQWFCRGNAGSSGWRSLIDRWLPLHLAIGLALGFASPVTMQQAANTVLLPLAGIFIGLSFAWVGNVQSLVSGEHITTLARYNPEGIEDYVYPFQLAVLSILGTMTMWGVAGLGVLDKPCPWDCPSWSYGAAASGLYALSSLSVRECWQVVFGAQYMLLTDRYMESRRLAEMGTTGAGGSSRVEKQP